MAASIELVTIQQILEVANQLRQLVADKQAVQPSTATAQIAKESLEFGERNQGDKVPFEVEITNTGNADLTVRLQPDCSCVSIRRNLTVAPGTTQKAAGQIDTQDFYGVLDKHVVVWTNDREKPVRRIPIRLLSVPRFRTVAPGGNEVLLDRQSETTIVLWTKPDKPLLPTGAKFEGLEADVTWKEWSAVMADPELNEKDQERKGYAFTIRWSPDIPEGRFTGTLEIATSDPLFPVLRHNLTIQRGIVASPENVFLGEVTAPGKSVGFLVQRPGLPFKITSAKIDHSAFKVSVEPGTKGDEWRGKVLYQGGAETGRLRATITLNTDDPKTPEVRLLVTGTLRGR
jgi:hypothetical protein